MSFKLTVTKIIILLAEQLQDCLMWAETTTKAVNSIRSHLNSFNINEKSIVLIKQTKLKTLKSQNI